MDHQSQGSLCLPLSTKIRWWCAAVVLENMGAYMYEIPATLNTSRLSSVVRNSCSPLRDAYAMRTSRNNSKQICSYHTTSQNIFD